MTESDKPSNRTESATAILMMIIPLAIIAIAFEVKHEGLRSAIRQSNEAAHHVAPPDADPDDEDLDLFE